jgi:hypothetical protein
MRFDAENFNINTNFGASCNQSKDVYVGIFENTQELINEILGGYDIQDLSNRRLPNGLNGDFWRQFIERDVNNGITFYGGTQNDDFESLFLRKNWGRMDEFNNIYVNRIQPIMQQVYRDFLSQGKIENPEFEYNDRELGNFAFERASVELLPIFEYYDDKLEVSVPQKNVEDKGEKTFDKTNGNEVFWIPKYEDKKKSKRACKLKKEGKPISEIMSTEGLQPPKYTSSVKKSFVYKKEKPKLKKAVRILLDLSIIGRRTPEQAIWRGYGAVGIIKFLESVGYATSLIGVESTAYGSGTISHDLICAVFLKNFGQPLDTSELLYGASDVSLVRVKYWLWNMLASSMLNNNVNGSHGGIMTHDCVVFNTFRSVGARYDRLWQENINSFSNRNTGNFLYITFGDCWSEDEMIAEIRRKITDVLNINNEAIQFAQANP